MLALRSLLLLALAAVGSTAQEAQPRAQDLVDELLARPAAQRTLWGVLALDLDTGETVYERNKDKLFLPASNVKLFSTALALTRLGAGFRFTTTLSTAGEADLDGILDGDLRLVGGGDPNLSSRPIPFRKRDVYGPDRLEPMRRLAELVRDAGIQRITGDVIGDDSRYVWQPYTRGWSHADTLRGYGSAASALVFNDNLVDVHIVPGATGGPARLRVVPQLGFYSLVNHTVTMAGRHVGRSLTARRGEQRGEVVLAGQIAAQSRGRTLQLAASDPARYAATGLKAALATAGVEVDGQARAHHLLPDRLRTLRSGPGPRLPAGERSIGELQSAPLGEVIRVVNKESQNLHAEILMREVALHESGIGSREAATAGMRRFLAEAGLGSTEFFLRDGSGLSRQNLLSPTAMVQLLKHMWESPDREAYLDSLPIAGQDGTLDWRFRRSGAEGRIRAKTGSMSHVLALSGYASNDSGGTLAFAIFANHFGLASSSTRRLVDAIAAALVRHRQPESQEAAGLAPAALTRPRRDSL